MNISLPIKNHFSHYSNQSGATIESIDSLEKLSNKDFEKIAEICNQELVYNLLFRKRLNGQKYEIKNAQGFINWAVQGWENREYFVFLIRNDKQEIIGACDIKSNNLESAEIGYWMSEEAPGFMTNAVVELCKVAEEMGFKQLFGLAIKDNLKSQNVLTRAGFAHIGRVEEDGEEYEKFSLNI